MANCKNAIEWLIICLLCPLFCIFYSMRTLWLMKSTILFSADVYTDFSASYHHFDNCDTAWAIWTLIFALLPMLIVGIISSIGIVRRKIKLQNRCIYNEEEDRVQQVGNSTRKRCLWGIGSICISPFLPLLHLLKDSAISIRDLADTLENIHYPFIPHMMLFINRFLMKICNNPFIHETMIGFTIIIGNSPEDAVISAGLVHLFEVLFESLLEGILQSYIIAQTWTGLADIGLWQYATISMSLISLTYAISTNPYVFQNGKFVSKVIVFIFGLVNTFTKLYVACVYSTVNKYLMCVPILISLVVSIMICPCKRFSECRSNDFFGFVIMFLSCVLDSIYNCFTMSALPSQVANMLLSAVCWLLPIPQSAAIIATVLSALVLAFNIAMTAVPLFRHHFGENWMIRKAIKLSSEEALAKKFEIRYSPVTDKYFMPSRSVDHGIEGWRAGVYDVSGDIYIEQYGLNAYLGKYGSKSGPATLRWRITWSGHRTSGSKGLSPMAITVQLSYVTEGDGKVTWHITLGDQTFPPDKTVGEPWGSFVKHESWLQLREQALAELGAVKHMDVVVTLTKKYGVAQLFLQKQSNNTDHPFKISVQFK